MDFMQYMSRAWQITWKHKVLWIFGLLAADVVSLNFDFRFGGGGGGGTAGTPVPGATPVPGIPPIPPTFPTPTPGDVAPWLFFGCCIFIVVIALFLLGIIMRGGLIGGIRLAEEQGSVTFSEAWQIGTQHFLRLLGLWIAPFLIMLFFVCALLNPLLWCLLCLIPILMIGVRVIVHFAQFAVVLENMSVVDSLRRGWAILKANFVNALILGVILFVIGIVVAIVVAIPIVIAVVSLIVPFAVQTSASASQARTPDYGLLAIAGLCVVCYLPVLLAVAAIYRTWDAAVWTLAYRFFAGNTPAPALPIAPSAPYAPEPPAPTPPPPPPAPPASDVPPMPT